MKVEICQICGKEIVTSDAKNVSIMHYNGQIYLKKGSV